MTTKCTCGGDLEVITATKPSLLNDELNYRTERQIFHTCNKCGSLYDTKEIVIFNSAKLDVLNETSPYIGLCRRELKYMPQLEGILDSNGEIEVVKEFMHESGKNHQKSNETKKQNTELDLAVLEEQ